MDMTGTIERGRVKAVTSEGYVIESLDRKGIITPPLRALINGVYAVNEIVLFVFFCDGIGLVISGDTGKITFPLDMGQSTAEGSSPGYITWKDASGAVYILNAYGNQVQLTRKANGQEKIVFATMAAGGVTFGQPLAVPDGGTGAKSQAVSIQAGFSTLLAAFNDVRGNRAFPISVQKSGAGHYSDLPGGVSATAEWNALFIGDASRAVCLFNPYLSDKWFTRHATNGAWTTSWTAVGNISA